MLIRKQQGQGYEDFVAEKQSKSRTETILILSV